MEASGSRASGSREGTSTPVHVPCLDIYDLCTPDPPTATGPAVAAAAAAAALAAPEQQCGAAAADVGGAEQPGKRRRSSKAAAADEGDVAKIGKPSEKDALLVDNVVSWTEALKNINVATEAQQEEQL